MSLVFSTVSDFSLEVYSRRKNLHLISKNAENIPKEAKKEKKKIKFPH